MVESGGQVRESIGEDILRDGETVEFTVALEGAVARPPSFRITVESCDGVLGTIVGLHVVANRRVS